MDPEKRQGRIGPETGPNLGKDQNPEGAKLRSVAGAKQIRQGCRVVLVDRPAESVETLGVGSGGSWQTRHEGLGFLQALESHEAQEGCSREGTGKLELRASACSPRHSEPKLERWRAGEKP